MWSGPRPRIVRRGIIRWRLCLGFFGSASETGRYGRLYTQPWTLVGIRLGVLRWVVGSIGAAWPCIRPRRRRRRYFPIWGNVIIGSKLVDSWGWWHSMHSMHRMEGMNARSVSDAGYSSVGVHPHMSTVVPGWTDLPVSYANALGSSLIEMPPWRLVCMQG